MILLGWEGWYMTLVLALKRQRQVDIYDLRPDWSTQPVPASQGYIETIQRVEWGGGNSCYCVCTSK